ncbi:MAG: response regulator [Ignavibacteria bacterium]|jgi:CheY-like chemotaxis protein|nr:response regulator [Ignavibacteria bacterium]MCU7501938.1 response regulator [Ignavibacteria bacterium]MCU7514716.1 response regulator [Ignavibacteria bacterium]
MEKNIIIVEDDPFTQEFYKYLFSKTKYQTTTIEDGDLLIEKIGENNTSLIIMDINLKNTYMKGEKVDGVMLSRFIKQNEQFSAIPILLVTAYQKNVGPNNYFEESLADDYIVKPIIDYNDLLNKVNKLIVN